MLKSYTPSPLSLYIHVPFCRSRCSYCAFNTYAGMASLIPAYVDAVCHEIRWLGKRLGSPEIRSIYFGGGTPSVLNGELLRHLIETSASAFQFRNPMEISLETNPQYVDAHYFRTIRALGINRLSIGAQSADLDELEMFGRRHHWDDVVSTVTAARVGGFENINLDLIYGAPGQTLNSWVMSLAQALTLKPTHIALYALSIEPETAMAWRVEAGQLVTLDGDLVADMYEAASDMLSGAGFVQYEISNWAQPGHECLHNLQYWHRDGYLGVGPGSYGFIDNNRYGSVDSITEYIDRVTHACSAHSSEVSSLTLADDPAKRDALTEHIARAETMMLGLRLINEGVSDRAFADRFGYGIVHYYKAEIQKLLEKRLLTSTGAQISLTPEARLISNQVMLEFM